MSTIMYNGRECVVLKERHNDVKSPDIRTVHTLSHFVDHKPNTCPFDESVILYSEKCIKCKNRGRYPNGNERPAYSIECLAFDCREQRHKGDALESGNTIVIYP